MRATVVPLREGRLGPLHCLNCQSELALCQPDIGHPDQLVGSSKVESAHGCCDQCRCLHVIGLASETEAVIMLLATMEVIHAAILAEGGERPPSVPVNRPLPDPPP